MSQIRSLSLDVELTEIRIEQLLQKNQFTELCELKVHASTSALTSFLKLNNELSRICCNDVEPLKEYVSKNDLDVNISQIDG